VIRDLDRRLASRAERPLVDRVRRVALELLRQAHRHHAGLAAANGVDVALHDPSKEFAYRPFGIGEPYGTTRAFRYDLRRLSQLCGASLRTSAIAAVEPERRIAITRDGERVLYDHLIVATGARMLWAVPGAATYEGKFNAPMLWNSNFFMTIESMKILRVLTDQSYTRVGGQRAVKVDVRVLSATSRNLQDEIAAGRFREDLFYRLNVVPVKLPSLRERREDIPELVSHFLARIAAERRMSAPAISEEAMAALQAHDWPGNVRQLRNIIERTLILAPGDRVACIEVDLLPQEILDNQTSMSGASTTMTIMGSPLREARESFEREYLKIQIRRFSGNISRTASFIGMERSALHRKLKALGIGDKREGEE